MSFVIICDRWLLHMNVIQCDFSYSYVTISFKIFLSKTLTNRRLFILLFWIWHLSILLNVCIRIVNGSLHQMTIILCYNFLQSFENANDTPIIPSILFSNWIRTTMYLTITDIISICFQVYVIISIIQNRSRYITLLNQEHQNYTILPFIW